jgi:YidC/Oxa1 family membrane protein insertase
MSMKRDPTEIRNIAVAVVLSLLLFIGWQYFIVAPQLEAQRQHMLAQKAAEEAQRQALPPGTVAPPVGGVTSATPFTPEKAETILANDTARIKLDSATVDGSIRLTGARFDDLHLKLYRQEADPKSPEIAFLIPQGAETATYGEVGWTSGGTSNVNVPTTTTLWQAAPGRTLTPDRPVTMTWDNGEGLLFTRTIALDKNYMFTITDTVENRSGAPVTLYPLRQRRASRRAEDRADVAPA